MYSKPTTMPWTPLRTNIVAKAEFPVESICKIRSTKDIRPIQIALTKHRTKHRMVRGDFFMDFGRQ